VLLELTVRDLGVIEDSTLAFGAGLTALTGETGAGKTLLVDALALVLGGRPPRGIVRDGSSAYVEATFRRPDGTEVILAREIPASGRARAWIDGRSASLAVLAEAAQGLCDIHGQHEHQSLLTAGAVRGALDAFGGIDRSAMVAARASLRSLEVEQSELGGGRGALEQECALLDHQVAEIDAAAIDDPDEIDRLLAEAALLADADRLRSSLALGLSLIEGGEAGGPRDAMARLRLEVDGHPSLAATASALESAELALDDAASTVRAALDSIEGDPRRALEVDERLRLLHELVRKHGTSLASVLEQRDALSARSSALRSSLARMESLEELLASAEALLADELASLERDRRQCAPRLLDALRARLSDLALGRAEIDLLISGPGGEHVELLFSANRGHALQPVGSVASGGELARLMLALRLILPGGPACMVFDEVDAGIGGSTALVLAAALAEVADDRQVLVVTHLAQVAARAASQVAVVKVAGERDGACASALDRDGRVAEIARMLSGHPDSPTARRHAKELLDHGASDAGRLPLV